MTHGNYLLILDDAPVDDAFRNYFTQFNIRIIQQSTHLQLPNDAELPLAILISWSLLKKQPQKITELYDTYPLPLFILNEKEDDDACIFLLESGADDFLVKPVSPRELHARIGAINRRIMRTQQQARKSKEVFYFDTWRLVPSSRQVFNSDDTELFLSAGEYDLLFAFVQQPQQILDREFLLHMTKNSDLNPFDRRIDVQISRLRQKIEGAGKKPSLIKTIRNGGYLFTAPVEVVLEPGN